MLQSMRVLPPTGKEGKEKKKTTDVLCVPLLQKALESDNCTAKVSIGNHRTLYIAARNVETLNRYCFPVGSRLQRYHTHSVLDKPDLMEFHLQYVVCVSAYACACLYMYVHTYVCIEY